MRGLAALAIALAATAGCIKSAAFECSTSSQCDHEGVAGTCEPTGACSFPDGMCSSGRRYGALSGARSDQCVGGESDIDAGMRDASNPAIDAPPDGPNCPSSYAALPGAGPNVYRLEVTPAAWANQRATCRADGSRVQLAVPDNSAELAAIVTLAGTNAWIGISDASLEGSYVTSYNVVATFLPWVANEPDNNGNQDCVRALGTGGIETQQCTTVSVAVCECVP